VNVSGNVKMPADGRSPEGLSAANRGAASSAILPSEPTFFLCRSLSADPCGVIVATGRGGCPALRLWRLVNLLFLFTDVGTRLTEKFGALAPNLRNRPVTSAIAKLIGIPVAFGIAVLTPRSSAIWLKRPLATMSELVGAIPRIFTAFWGPLYSRLRQSTSTGDHRLRSGQLPWIGALSPVRLLHRRADCRLSLSSWCLPFISALMRDVSDRAGDLKESAYAPRLTRARVRL